MQVARVLRKGLEPDAVVWLSTPYETLTEGQRRMLKGARTVFEEWVSTGPGVAVLEV